MTAMDFIRMYIDNPIIAIVIFASMVAIVIFGFSAQAYLKYKKEKRILYEKELEEQFKRKYKIK